MGNRERGVGSGKNRGRSLGFWGVWDGDRKDPVLSGFAGLATGDGIGGRLLSVD